jgi:hypothetical protein
VEKDIKEMRDKDMMMYPQMLGEDGLKLTKLMKVDRRFHLSCNNCLKEPKVTTCSKHHTMIITAQVAKTFSRIEDITGED